MAQLYMSLKRRYNVKPTPTIADVFGAMSDLSSDEEGEVAQPPISKRTRFDSVETGKSTDSSDSDSSDSDSSDTSSSSSSDSDSDSSEDETEIIQEQPKAQPLSMPQFDSYSTTSRRMMEKMGFKNDIGLGKSGQGRLEPIEASSQNGRRGLGLKLDNIDLTKQIWTPNMENIQLRETVKLIADRSNDLETISIDVLNSWIVKSSKKLTIDDETRFCDPAILQKVLAQKSVFDKLSANDMNNARRRSNPFEMIESSIFMNRAAVKMANMDSLFGFMFTEPMDESGKPLAKKDELFYFADVCAGPGGFSEYILWRKNWHAKGFGFTLKGENDFKLEKFLAGHPETFNTHYGAKEDGNIYDPENIDSYTNYVHQQTTKGVHLMMSDGGFSVEGQENIQEILSKQLYLCQCLTALSVVRVDGHFVTKVFDLFTPFSVGLVYLMYKCFKEICIVKPNSSRPANSERYLVCKWKKSNTSSIRNYLYDVNTYLFKNKETKNTDISELVPMEVIQADKEFYNYILESNNTIGQEQVNGLLKIAHFSANRNMRERRQVEMKRTSLEMWKLPNEERKLPVKVTSDNLFKQILGDWYAERSFMSSIERQALARNYEKTFFDNSDWAFVPIEVTENTNKSIRTFFMSKGNSDVYKYTEYNTWEPLTEIHIEVSPNTLFYGEIVKELTGEGRAQKMVYAMHIIDGMILGGEDIRSLDILSRNEKCQQFAEALNKPERNIGNNNVAKFTAAIRCKEIRPLLRFQGFFNTLKQYKLKDNKVRPGILVQSNRFYVPRGLMLFKVLKPNLYKKLDASIGKYVCTDLTTKQRFILDNNIASSNAFGSFKSTFAHRKLWKWEDPRQVAETIDDSYRHSELLYRADFEKLIYKK